MSDLGFLKDTVEEIANGRGMPKDRVIVALGGQEYDLSSIDLQETPEGKRVVVLNAEVGVRKVTA